ncbi:hypothetical protein LCGC14_2303930, partial [marine sediment metagenome]
MNPPHAQAVVLAFYANRPGATPSDKALVEMGFDTLDHYYKKRDALARRGLLHIERRSVVPGEGGGRPRVSAFLTPTGERFLEECLANPHPLFDTARNAAKRELPVRSLRIASLKDRSEFLQQAVARGIPLSSEMNLFIERCPARRIVGITGSAG